MNNEDDKLELERATIIAESIAVGEHVEEVDHGGTKVPRRGIYLLPTMITLGALFAGFYAIIVALHGLYESAVLALFVAMLLDGLDGRVARLTNTQSAFGAELDSLADMVSFGVAPALIMFSWALQPLGRWGWAIAFVYAACAAMRLARFNTEIGKGSNSAFKGLASPAAAAVMVSFVWCLSELGYVDKPQPLLLSLLAAVLTAVVGMAMVTNIGYRSFKEIDLRGRVPFVVLVIIIAGFTLVMIDPPTVLLLVSGAYAASGPFVVITDCIKRRRAASSPETPAS